MLIKKRTSIKFAEGTKDGTTVLAPSKDILKPNISRYHSLGTDMPDEDALRGFSWESPDIGELASVETSSSTTSGLDKEVVSRSSHTAAPVTTNINTRIPPSTVAGALSTTSGTVIEEDDYYYMHRQSQPIDASHTTSPTTYRSKLQRDHSLAMNPLRHATTREPGSTYRPSLDQDVVPYYHQQQRPEEEELYSSTYTIQQADHRQQQQSTLTIRKKNTPHNSSTSDVYSPYPLASDTSHYRSIQKKEPYSHYNNTAVNTALEPLYYQDELDEEYPSTQPYTEYWPEAAPKDYDQDIISQTGYSAQQPYGFASANFSSTVPRTTSRASGSGERIHVPASSPSVNSSRAQPSSITMDYHPTTNRPEYRTGPTVVAGGANSDGGRTHRDYREKVHSAVPILETGVPQDYFCSERTATSTANDYDTKDALYQIGLDHSAKVVITPQRWQSLVLKLSRTTE
jgi:hypothetical protein